VTDQSTADAESCLYDGSAKAAAFTEKQLAKVLSAVATAEAAEPAVARKSPAADEGALAAATGPSASAPGAAPTFKVITNIRSKNFGPSSKSMRAPFGIVLHHTGGSFEGDLATLTKSGTGVSANDYIDKQGRIFELCEFPKRAWHAGDADLHGITDWNRHGWGIEIENLGKANDPYPRKQIDAIVWRCRERRRKLGITSRKMLVRHRDICVPRNRKPDTSDNFPLEEVRRRVFAPTDPTDKGITGGELTMEKYNVAGLGVFPGQIAAAFAAVLRGEGVKAMAIHSRANVRTAAEQAAVAPFRKGPRLVVIGGSTAAAVRKAGQKVGTEQQSDLFGAVGTGDSPAARLADTVAKAEDLLAKVCRVEKKDPRRARRRFRATLAALDDAFVTKT
jgi:N-acetyl-anhydromuramyl-L-alanine amidase AmpD